MKDKIWAYLMHLGDNMWFDYCRPGIAPGYYETLTVDDDVWRQTIDFLPQQGINTVLIDVGDGMQYERHPEISVKGAWSKERLKKELDYIRSLGMTPLPKLNFSAGHDAWLKEYSRMLSTSVYYQVCKDVIEEVAEVFNYPELFHVGMDEEDATNQAGLQYCCIRQKDLWWHDSYYLFDICHKLGMRPWVWADPCWHNPDEYLKRMPKEVIQSNWWYNRIRKNTDGSYKDVRYDTYRVLEEAGFEQIPTCSTCYGYQWNAYETMQLAEEVIEKTRLRGYMTAPWRNPRTDEIYLLFNDALRFGHAKKTIYSKQFV